MIIRSITFFIAIILMASSGIAQTKTMQIAGVSRNYILHAPSGVTNPPFMLCIHGYNMDAASQQSYTQMDKIADREKFIVVYPNAVNKSWDMSGANDFTYIMAIIDSVDKAYKIDKSKIYACGFSQGGFMSFNLGCRYSDVFAAIAPTSGNMSGNCTLKRPMSMRLTFGTNEGFTGGTAAFMANVTKWLDLCNCPKTPVVTSPYPSTNSKSVVTRLYYGPCDGGTEVIADSIRTGGHEWPMNTNDRINNSEETWAFLKKFSLSATSTISQHTDAKAYVAPSAAYVSGSIRLQGINDESRVQIVDTKGRVVMPETIASHVINFNHRAGGVYLVTVATKSNAFTLRLVVP